jgi:hypothetical protein
MDNWSEKRASQRIQVGVPVHIGRERAVTRDVGWSGIYVLTKQAYPEGTSLHFALDLAYALPGKPVKLDCQGEVVRLERHGKQYGIAARINNFQYLQ